MVDSMVDSMVDPDEFCEVVLRAVQTLLGTKSTAQTFEVNALGGGRDVTHEFNMIMKAINCIEAKSEEKEVRQAFVLNCSEMSRMEVERTIY